MTTLIHSPANGMPDPSCRVPKSHGTAIDLSMARNRPPDTIGGLTGRLPKLSFPSFKGKNTQFWITQAEDYFDLYSVDMFVWIRAATMHFSRAAKRWV